MDRPRTGEVLIGLLFPLLLLLSLVLLFFRWEHLHRLFASPEVFAAWIEAQPSAPLVFIAVQFFQVLIFMVPGEIPQMAGGYLFGTVMGLVYSLTGIALGSMVNFYIGRYLGSRFVRIILGEQRFGHFSHLLSTSKAHTGFFLFFLIPGFPKDALCYLAGLASITPGLFIVLSLLGRLPGLVTSVMAGNAAAGGEWILLAVIGGVVAAVSVLGFIYRRPLKEFVDRIVHRH